MDRRGALVTRATDGALVADLHEGESAIVSKPPDDDLRIGAEGAPYALVTFAEVH